MAGTRSRIARTAREAVLGKILGWTRRQVGTKQALCQRLQISATQLHVLLNEGAERCSLEYLLDLWERCGGNYSLQLTHDTLEAHGPSD